MISMNFDYYFLNTLCTERSSGVNGGQTENCTVYKGWLALRPGTRCSQENRSQGNRWCSIDGNQNDSGCRGGQENASKHGRGGMGARGHGGETT